MRSHRASWVRDDRATSAIEFALLTPVFLLLLTGMLAYGIYFGAANSLQQLTADAARVAIAGLNEAERNRLVEAYLDNNADQYLLLDSTHLTYTIRDDTSDPNQYLVTLRYDASELPIWNLYVPLPLPSSQIAYSSTIRRGGI
ncbi:MAG TPA: TadE/TadG family type IV pilus assembly protein [Devosia sp.]|nr:TadE/TadG family type IV pilus assembly protein [Devosia sp.]